MAVNSISDMLATNYSTTKTQSTSSTTLSMTDFYELLAAQLKYQDMDNPADMSEMMSMMVQSQMIEAITNMAYTNTTSYAASLVGKEVTVAETDADGAYKGDVVGTVTGVVLGDNPIVMVDGKSYSLSQVMAVGSVTTSEDTE